MPVARKLWQPMRMQMPAASAQRPITRKTSPCPIGLPDKRPRPAGHEGHLVLSAPASLAAAALATEVSVFDLDPAGLLPARLGQPHRDDRPQARDQGLARAGGEAELRDRLPGSARRRRGTACAACDAAEASCEAPRMPDLEDPAPPQATAEQGFSPHNLDT